MLRLTYLQASTPLCLCQFAIVAWSALGDSLRTMMSEGGFFSPLVNLVGLTSNDKSKILLSLIMKELSFLVLSFKSWNILQNYRYLKISVHLPKSRESYTLNYIKCTHTEHA